jgi:hypothetical protein
MITLFHGKRLTDFECHTEGIQRKSGLFDWSSTFGFERSQAGNACLTMSPTLMVHMD